MNGNNNSLDLATQVLQEQLSLLSDTPENTEVDLSKTKAILDVTKQIVDVEKLKASQVKTELEQQQFIYGICKDVSAGTVRHIPQVYSNQVKLIE